MRVNRHHDRIGVLLMKTLLLNFHYLEFLCLIIIKWIELNFVNSKKTSLHQFSIMFYD